MRKALSHLSQLNVKVSAIKSEKNKKNSHNHDPVGYQRYKEMTWMQVLFLHKKKRKERLTSFDITSVPDEHGMLSKLNTNKS